MRRVLRLSFAAASVAALVTAGLLVACGDDDNVAANGRDASVDSSPAPGTDSGLPPGTDAGQDAGGVVTFTVPAGGGSVTFQGASGPLSFVFPASAGGQTITLAPANAGGLGFAAGTFVDAIKLGPDGTHFTDPVVVKPQNKAGIGAMFSFAGAPTAASPGSPLFPNAAGDGFELRHFSTLVLVPPGKSCDSMGGGDTPSSSACADAGTATTLRSLGCKGFSFCMYFDVACCVDPAVDGGPGCSMNDKVVRYNVGVMDSNGGQYPYCDVDAGDWDGGASTCGQVKPTVNYDAVGGCSMLRTCGGGVYGMSCNGTTCTCTFPAGTTTSTFAQATTCDTGKQIETAYAQKCNFPVAQ